MSEGMAFVHDALTVGKSRDEVAPRCASALRSAFPCLSLASGRV